MMMIRVLCNIHMNYLYIQCRGIVQSLVIFFSGYDAIRVFNSIMFIKSTPTKQIFSMMLIIID